MNQEGLMFPKTQKKRKKRMKHPKSIIHEKNGTCYLCMLLDGNHKKHLLLDEHHIFGGPNRIHSEENGLKVWLCLDHHTMGSLAVHRCPDTMRLMHRIGQQEYEKTHSRQQFIEILEKVICDDGGTGWKIKHVKPASIMIMDSATEKESW